MAFESGSISRGATAKTDPPASKEPRKRTLRVRVGRDGVLSFALYANLPVIHFANYALITRCAGRNVELVPIYQADRDTRIEVYFGQDRTKPLTAFYFDSQNQLPYFHPRYSNVTAKEERIYSLRLKAIGDQAEINGVTYYKASDCVGEIFNVRLIDGQHQAVVTTEYYAELYSLRVVDRQGQLIGVLVGQNENAAFALPQGGIVGPFKLQSNHVKEDGKRSYHFPSSGAVSFLQSDLKQLRIRDPKRASVCCEKEAGHPVAVYAEADTEFERPILLKLVRAEDWRLLASGRQKLKEVDLSGIKIIEGLPTSFVIHHDRPEKRPREIVVIKRVQHPVAMRDHGEKLESRPVSAVCEDGRPFLIVHAPRIDAEMRRIVNLVLVAKRAGKYTSQARKEIEAQIDQYLAGEITDVKNWRLRLDRVIENAVVECPAAPRKSKPRKSQPPSPEVIRARAERVRLLAEQSLMTRTQLQAAREKRIAERAEARRAALEERAAAKRAREEAKVRALEEKQRLIADKQKEREQRAFLSEVLKTLSKAVRFVVGRAARKPERSVRPPKPQPAPTPVEEILVRREVEFSEEELQGARERLDELCKCQPGRYWDDLPAALKMASQTYSELRRLAKRGGARPNELWSRLARLRVNLLENGDEIARFMRTRVIQPNSEMGRIRDAVVQASNGGSIEIAAYIMRLERV